MLVLGCMRSASTSVSEALIKISGIPRHFEPPLPGRVSGYEYYPSSTADIISKEMLTDWVCSKNYIIQEHLLPIEEHREILLSIPLEKRKIVILKRDWEDSFASQVRRNGGKGDCPYKSRTTNKEYCRASFKKFREDLEIFFPEKDGYLHVEFTELMDNKSKILAKILNYYNINYKKENLILPHLRRTR